MPAHLSGKHRGIGSQPVPEDTKLDKRDDVQQFTPSGRVKRKAASKANKKVVQAFKDIDASIDGETFEETKDIDGVGDFWENSLTKFEFLTQKDFMIKSPK